MLCCLLGWNTELISVGFFYKGWAVPDEGAESDQWGPHHLRVCSLLRPFLSLTPNQHVHPSTSSLFRPGFYAESRPQTPSWCRKESDGRRGHHLRDICLNRHGNDGQIRASFGGVYNIVTEACVLIETMTKERTMAHLILTWKKTFWASWNKTLFISRTFPHLCKWPDISKWPAWQEAKCQLGLSKILTVAGSFCGVKSLTILLGKMSSLKQPRGTQGPIKSRHGCFFIDQ